jgi:acetoin utilization protein AcuB
MRVKDVMQKQVRTIKPNDSASLAKELFRRYDINHLVVVDQKNVIGMIADRDLMDVGPDTPVQRAMAHPPVTITPDETVRKAAALMTGHVIGSLPVVDDGKLVGIVTSYDLLNLLAKGSAHPAPNRERPVLAKRGPRPKPFPGIRR